MANGRRNKGDALVEWLGFSTNPDFAKARWIGRLIGWGSVALYTAIVLTLVVGLIAVLFVTIGRFLDADTATSWEGYRWFLLTIATLTATLGAAIALPFTVLRTRYTQRQTIAAEQNLITARINEAVEGLGAEKVVKVVIERPVYIVDEAGNFVRNEDGDLRPVLYPDGTAQVERDEVERTEPNIEVRVGAILSLERISQNSREDHVRIMEILCAYVRENACLVPTSQTPDGEQDWAQRTDTQMAVTVLGRRDQDKRDREASEGYALDLRGANLQRADMTAGAWRQARLQRANLGKALMNHANLQEAKLVGANLQGAMLWDANLQGAKLVGANLQGAELVGANLQGAELVGANLQGAELVGATLNSADLRYWTIARTFLRSAEFTDSHNLSQEAVNSAFGVASGIGRTILPEGLTPPAHWHMAEDAQEDSHDHYDAAVEAYRAWLATLPEDPDDSAP